MSMLKKNYPFRIYFKFTPIFVLLVIAFVVQVINWFWLLSTIGIHREIVFLHYNILYGVDLTGPGYHLFALPLIGFMVFVLNGFLGWLMFGKDRFVSILLNAISLIIQIFLLVAVALLIFLNT